MEAPGGNFDLHADRSSQMLAVAFAFAVLQSLIVLARFLASRNKKARLGLDDWVILPALVFTLGVDIVVVIFVYVANVGKHTAAVKSPAVLVRWAKCLLAVEVLYSFAIALSKFSILLFYLRIFATRSFKIAVYVIAFTVLGWGFSVAIVAIFQCSPVHHAWDKESPGTCINQLAFYRYISLPNIITDLMMLVLPWKYVWRLQIRFGQKAALTGIFLMGSIGCISSIVRFSIFFRSDAFADPTWTSVDLLTWTVVEAGTILIAACLPALRPLFIKSTSSSDSRSQSTPVKPLSRLTSPYQSSSNGPYTGFNRLGGRGWGYPSSTISGSNRERTGSETDAMPLNAIAVKCDLHWSTSERNIETGGEGEQPRMPE